MELSVINKCREIMIEYAEELIDEGNNKGAMAVAKASRLLGEYYEAQEECTKDED